MRIALAQLNPTVGDVAGNTTLVAAAIERARADDAEILVCPELVILGYPPRDLLLRAGVVEACESAVQAIAAAAGDMTVIVGHPRRGPDGVRTIRNSASVCRNGIIETVGDKRLLPGYDVFDEDRYFDPGTEPCVFERDGRRIGVLTCEDLWRAGDVVADPHYDVDPLGDVLDGGAEIVVTLNASPFIVGKFNRHVARLKTAAREHRVPIVAVNQVGANDDLVFDGRSMVVDRDGEVLARLPAWEPAVTVVDLAGPASGPLAPPASDRRRGDLDDIYHALVLGVRDYCRKTGHRHVLLGLSGGIDSALTATLACAALGPENVRGVMMPSRHSSPGSITDAEALARRLGLPPLERIPIESMHDTVAAEIATGAGETPRGLTDENIQSRLRGLILMARSNATGALVLPTCNKSELAVGYATLYGDMCGALAVLGDLVKTRVYDLARWINAHHAAYGFAQPPIPEPSITKPPSAELRPDQTDQDSLPPYDVLDAIIERIVDLEESAGQIIATTGFEETLVRETVAAIDRSEFKRHQSAVIPKVTHRAFGRGRPMPIVMWSTTDADLGDGTPLGDRTAVEG